MIDLLNEIIAVQEAANDEIERGIEIKLTNALVKRAIKRSPTAYLALCAVVNALRPHAGLLAQPSSVIVLRAPADWRLTLFTQAAEDLLLIDSLPHRNRSNRVVIMHPGTTAHDQSSDFDVGAAFARRHLIVVTNYDSPLIQEVEISHDVVVQLEVCQKRDLRALGRIQRAGTISNENIEFVRTLPTNMINAIYRFGQPGERAIERLRNTLSPEPQSRPELSLDDLPGFGNAGAWGKELAADIQAWREGKLAWSEIDKGVLLHGAPGTGKTVFARALAKTCGMEFIPTSMAQWQKHGHLGDMLREMNNSFKQARTKAPAILFLDEVDSVGDREGFSHANANYSIQVVNALLELIDGSFGRHGVIVVGACNNPKRIDPALLRSGRLERHIHFGEPDAAARKEIMAFYLPELKCAEELQKVAARVEGWTHADLNKLGRELKKVARRNNRELVSVEDLQGLLPAPEPLSPELVERIAIHEAGHAVCALVVGREIEFVSILTEHDGADRTTPFGVTMLVPVPSVIKTEDDFMNQISVFLAGMVAEEVILKRRSSSAGGGDESDLERATELAYQYVAELGLGDTLTYIPSGKILDLRQNADLRRNVDAILKRQYRQTKYVIEGWAQAVREIADELVGEGKLSGQRAQEILLRRLM